VQKHKGIEYHGMIWIFDKLVETSVLSKKEAAIKLKQLVVTNFIFRNNQPLVAEIEKRLKIWTIGFPDTAGQAVQNVIHLSRCLPDLIGQYRRVNACYHTIYLYVGGNPIRNFTKTESSFSSRK
jgi:hypothetical protein